MESTSPGRRALRQDDLRIIAANEDPLEAGLSHTNPGRRVIVFGYGNTIRGDDGIGPSIAEELKGRFDEQQVEVRALPMLSSDLILDLARAKNVLFIDADRLLEPLTWKVATVVPRKIGPSPFSCQVEPDELLHWTQALYGRHPEAKFLHIGAQYFDFDEWLSPDMARLLPRLMAVAASVIDTWLRDGSEIRTLRPELQAQP